MTMNITTLLFDFVGVLMRADRSGVISPEAVVIDRRVGKVVDDHAFRETVMNELGYSAARFDSLIAQIAGRYIPFEPLWQMLPGLRQHYRLGVINNGTYWTYPYFNTKYGIESQFDVFVSSAREGVRKPDPAIYLRACAILNVRPAECLYMDDSAENVESAARLGMRTIWWETHQAGFAQFCEWVEWQRAGRGK